ncbi:hypothetical protein DDT47_15970 [Mycobacteroides abscessus]|nr:hypothetical protein DDT53_16055 [Mycobacteroides abscessus]AWG60364.1 hypothetical protein DDT47_15970 [Mycobacteroides abscessus]AWG68753.1 hypothetical protein DDT49_08365 [Mycobacteroides abscessus]PVA98921.1 hypothetical protein DDJ51_24870 [Mycobacteroides abscessus]PVB26395.1 hypothetical protein DDJ92_24550 [Mycobacteroides abscessus]
MVSVCPIGSQPITGVCLILVLLFLTGFGLMTSTTRRGTRGESADAYRCGCGVPQVGGQD